MILISFASVTGEVAQSVGAYNRVMVISSQGFAQPVPIARLAEVATLPGVDKVSPFSWYGGKFRERVMPFAQFGVDPDTFFSIYDELELPPSELKAWQADRAGCVIGKKLAKDWNLKVGDELPLKDGVYPFNLILRVRGIFDGPPNRDLRACYFNWYYLEEGLKQVAPAMAGNAGTIVVHCKDAGQMAAIARKIDESTANSDTPTKTQTEEAFGQMFAEMSGDFQWIIVAIGLAVGVSLLSSRPTRWRWPSASGPPRSPS